MNARHDVFPGRARRLRVLPGCLLVAAMGLWQTPVQAQFPQMTVLFDPLQEDYGLSGGPGLSRYEADADCCLPESDISSDARQNDSPGTPSSPRSEIDQLMERIADIGHDPGASQERPEELYYALSRLHEQHGDLPAAVAALEEALRFVRERDGLESPEQLALLDQMIELHRRLGDIAAGDELHAYRIHVLTRNHEQMGPELLQGLMMLADWHVLAFAGGHLLGSEGSPGKDRVILEAAVSETLNGLGSGLFVTATPPLMEEHLLVNERLVQARNAYEFVLENTRFEDNTDLHLMLTEKLLGISVLAKHWFETNNPSEDRRSMFRYMTSNRNAVSHRLFRKVYRQDVERQESLIDHFAAGEDNSPLTLARLYLSLGDYHLEYRYGSKARRAYRTARQLLEDAGLSDQQADAFINPQQPVAIPVYATSPYSRSFHRISPEAVLAYDGVIETSMDIDSNGQTRSVEVVAMSDDTPPEVVKALTSLLENQLFRPRVDDDRLSGKDGVVQKYGYLM